MSNFKDLALISAFSKSKDYIFSLIEEINRDVFENSGRIQMNVGSDLWYEDEYTWDLKKKIPSSENIILFCSSYLTDKRYIGVLEHGGVDIRIIAQNDKYKYWDIEIDEIIEGLRTAIKWWKTDGRYTEEEAEVQNYIDQMSEIEEESKLFWDEMHSLGLTDEDFEGRD